MSDIRSEPARGAGRAVAIDVRCGCGQLVYADERFAGRHVQCPHCRAAVAVPVAAGAAAPPAPPERAGPSFGDTADGRTWGPIGGFVALTLVVGFLRGGREDAQKNRPSAPEIMQKARVKGR